MTTLLSLEEAAERLRRSPITVRRMLKRGDLDGIMAGGSIGWQVPDDAIEAYIARERGKNRAMVRSPRSAAARKAAATRAARRRQGVAR